MMYVINCSEGSLKVRIQKTVQREEGDMVTVHAVEYNALVCISQ